MVDSSHFILKIVVGEDANNSGDQKIGVISSGHFILKIIVGEDANNSGDQKIGVISSGHFILKIIVGEDANNSSEVIVRDKIFAGTKKKTVEFLNKAVK
jgi:hypothetical protein